MKHKTLTITSIIIMLIIFALSTTPVSASTSSDKALAKSWAKTYYSEPIKFVHQGQVPNNRIGTTYIEILKTKSKGGKKGYTIKGKYFVRYPKKVKKGKKVTVFLVYNPQNNACDDVVAMVCLGVVK